MTLYMKETRPNTEALNQQSFTSWKEKKRVHLAKDNNTSINPHLEEKDSLPAGSLADSHDFFIETDSDR